MGIKSLLAAAIAGAAATLALSDSISDSIPSRQPYVVGDFLNWDFHRDIIIWDGSGDPQVQIGQGGGGFTPLEDMRYSIEEQARIRERARGVLGVANSDYRRH